MHNPLIHAQRSDNKLATPIRSDLNGNLQTRVGGTHVPANAAGATIGPVTGRVLRNTPGLVVQMKITNTSASAQWYGIYDCTTVGAADGAANLIDEINVGAATTVVYPWPLPAFILGCTVVNNGATVPHAGNAPGSANSQIFGIVD